MSQYPFHFENQSFNYSIHNGAALLTVKTGNESRDQN